MVRLSALPFALFGNFSSLSQKACSPSPVSEKHDIRRMVTFHCSQDIRMLLNATFLL